MQADSSYGAGAGQELGDSCVGERRGGGMERTPGLAPSTCGRCSGRGGAGEGRGVPGPRDAWPDSRREIGESCVREAKRTEFKLKGGTGWWFTPVSLAAQGRTVRRSERGLGVGGGDTDHVCSLEGPETGGADGCFLSLD